MNYSLQLLVFLHDQRRCLRGIAKKTESFSHGNAPCRVTILCAAMEPCVFGEDVRENSDVTRSNSQDSWKGSWTLRSRSLHIYMYITFCLDAAPLPSSRGAKRHYVKRNMNEFPVVPIRSSVRTSFDWRTLLPSCFVEKCVLNSFLPSVSSFIRHAISPVYVRVRALRMSCVKFTAGSNMPSSLSMARMRYCRTAILLIASHHHGEVGCSDPRLRECSRSTSEIWTRAELCGFRIFHCAAKV